MDFMKSARFHEIHMKYGRFHEIQWISGEIWQISGEIHPKPCKIRRVFAETSAADFWNIWFHLKSTRFHGWNLPDFMDFMKSARISWWNPPDFMVKICRISWTWAFGWWSSIGLSIERPIRCFSKTSSDWSFEKRKTYTWSSCKGS